MSATMTATAVKPDSTVPLKLESKDKDHKHSVSNNNKVLDLAPEDDWRRIPDRKAKKRVQNRVAQRSYRQRMKARLEELQAKVQMHEQKTETDPSDRCGSPSQSVTPQRQYSPNAHIGIATDMDALQSHKRRRSTSDVDYDMSCGYVPENPNAMSNMSTAMPTPPHLASIPEYAGMYGSRPRAYTTGDPNLDITMQLQQQGAMIDQQVAMQADQPLGPAFPQFMPTPPMLDARGQMHGSPLHPSCFADITMNGGTDGTHIHPSALHTNHGGPMVGPPDFVSDFSFQDPEPIPMSMPMDAWKTAAISQPASMTPVMGFQATPESLALSDRPSSMEQGSHSPPREMGHYKHDSICSQDPLFKPSELPNMEERLRFVTDQAKAMGFPSFDDAVMAYYNHSFPESSPLYNEQRLSRNRRLPRVLATVRESAQEWSEWERRGFQEEIVRSAEENLVREFHAFKTGDRFMDCVNVLNQSRYTHNHPMRRKVQDELPNLWALMAALTAKNGSQRAGEGSRAVLSAIGSLAYADGEVGSSPPPRMSLDGSEE